MHPPEVVDDRGEAWDIEFKIYTETGQASSTQGTRVKAIALCVIEELAAHRIAFQVVPGITAASGCAAYSGIPLTHRNYSQSCRFVTGHLQNNTMDLPWHELVAEQQTIVFYMGLTGAEHISRQMIKHGMRADMPVALVEKGTLPEQKVYTTTLAGLEHLASREDIHAPTLIIVGEIVKLREKLNWYHQG